MDENEKNEKSPEEIYLDQLYQAYETGEVPDGMIPLQVPSLNDPNQKFREINLPVKRKKTTWEHIATTANVLSFLYFLAGFVSYQTAIFYEHLTNELTQLLFWVFVIGTAISVFGLVVSLALRSKIKTALKILPLLLLAACAAMMITVAQ